MQATLTDPARTWYYSITGEKWHQQVEHLLEGLTLTGCGREMRLLAYYAQRLEELRPEVVCQRCRQAAGGGRCAQP